MLNRNDILETINMIHTDHLDIRTITMGISLLDCASDDAAVFAGKIYDKISLFKFFIRFLNTTTAIEND